MRWCGQRGSVASYVLPSSNQQLSNEAYGFGEQLLGASHDEKKYLVKKNSKKVYMLLQEITCN